MKSKIIDSAIRITMLVFAFALLLPFQNCAVYESDGRKAFESSLAQSENKGCYPYVDTNLASGFIGATDGSLSVYKAKVSGEDAYLCDFITTNASLDYINHVNCKVSVGSGDNAIILKDEGENAFAGIVASSLWTATARPGFTGSTHGGYVTLDLDGMYTVRYLALDGTETKGVACAVRMTSGNYTTAGKLAAVKNAISNMALEMAICNGD